MRIAVVGAGAVGGYLGARLAVAGNSVHLLARGPHLEAIRGRGLTVRSPLGDIEGLRLPAGDDPHGVGPVDVVLLTVKNFDLAEALHVVGLLVDDDTAVLCLQNGMIAVEEATEAIGAGRVLGGIAYIEAKIGEPGVIEHRSRFARIIFGELDGRLSARVRELQRVCDAAGIEATASSDVLLEMWRKWMFICAFSGMTALSRRPIGEIMGDPDMSGAFRSILAEVAALARASGVALKPEDVEERFVFARDRLHPEMRSSLQNDLEAGRRLEIESLNGYAVRLGRRLAVPTPANELVYAALKPYRHGASKVPAGEQNDQAEDDGA